MSKEIKPRSRKEKIVVQEVDGETLIYDLERNRALCLNATSAMVWQACNGKHTIAQISDLVGKKHDTQTNEDIVWLALDQLSKERLVEPEVDVAARFVGMSRRQVIKKIGVGSMIALPMVASLVAPPAIHAQSLGSLAPGAVSGTATTAAVMCGGAGTPQTARDAACNTQTGSFCQSGMAAQQQPGICMDVGPGAEFSCVCT
jgi:Coenzyme PQQ synthesis protein D (PqqD)